jgi:hypothetical protein
MSLFCLQREDVFFGILARFSLREEVWRVFGGCPKERVSTF